MTGLKEKTALIFGGGGFIGSHMVEALIDECAVIVFDKKHFSRQNISRFEGQITIVEGDFSNHRDWEDIATGVDYILHFIGTTLPAVSNENCTYDVESNVVPSIQLLDVLKNNSRSRIIFISSGGTVYGNAEKLPLSEEAVTNPICSYGISKLMIEKYLHLYHTVYGLDYITARLSNAYGERQNITSQQGLITTILYKALHDQPVQIWGDGMVVRDYIYVKDAVDCLKKMLLYEGPQRTFNVSSNRGYSVNEVIKVISETIGKKPAIRYGGGRKCDVRDNILNNALAQKELGWKPNISLPEGVARVYHWLQAHAKE